jgi:site-specific DNA recombinase
LSLSDLTAFDHTGRTRSRGTKIRALNDRGDDSPEGDLTDGILDQLAKYERAKMTERSRRGKLRKAREGKVIAGRMARYGSGCYGFALNDAHDALIVDEEKMAVVRLIFRMVGVEGQPINAAKRTLDASGVPTPTGKPRWSVSTLRDIISNDVYRPHSFEEVRLLVSPEVAAHLDSQQNYGLWKWFFRESDESGAGYRRMEERVLKLPKRTSRVA